MRPIVEPCYSQTIKRTPCSRWKCIHRHLSDDGETGCKSAGRRLRWWHSLNHSAPRACLSVWICCTSASVYSVFFKISVPRCMNSRKNLVSHESGHVWVDWIIYDNALLRTLFYLIQGISLLYSFHFKCQVDRRKVLKSQSQIINIFSFVLMDFASAVHFNFKWALM